MSNLKHYLHGIIACESYYTLQRKLSFIASALTVFHLLMAIAFFLLHIYSLMILNIFSVIFYTSIVFGLIRKERYVVALMLSFLEISHASFVTTVCLGMDTGFSAYLIAMITSAFYFSSVFDDLKKKDAVPFFLSITFISFYLITYILMQKIQPLFELPNKNWVFAFYISNHLISFIMMIVFSYLFVWENKCSQQILAKKNEQLDELAHKDPLTHLLNRRSMNILMLESMDALKRNGKRFSLILCDIDDFKKVNDTYGHDAGDFVLIAISNIITQSVRSDDAVCRWGGEEILILINDPVETASMTAERIRKKIEDYVTYYEDQEIKITMTFGISESIPGYKIENLIQQADDKLYLGKKSGKNTVVV